MKPVRRTRRVQAFEQSIDHIAAGLENKQFAEMYATAVKNMLRGDPVLFEFMGALERAPVSIEEFMDSPEFFGATDISIWPEVRQAIIEINCNWWKGPQVAYNEAILMGATGCVDSETEYLCHRGWVKISDYREGDRIAQYGADGEVQFIAPREYVKAPCTSFLHFKARSVDQMLTLGHTFVYRSAKTGKLLSKTAMEVATDHNLNAYGFKGEIISAFDSVAGTAGLDLSDEELRLMVAVHADGNFPKGRSACLVRVKKERKKARMRLLLREAGVPYTEQEVSPYDGFVKFTFQAPLLSKSYAGFWAATQEQLEIICDEVLRWDGDTIHKQRYFTGDKASADFIQYAFATCGKRASLCEYTREGGNPEYTLNIEDKGYTTLATSQPSSKQLALPVTTGDGFCYCFRTDTGMWVQRRNGKVSVTGNTGKSTIVIISIAFHAYLISCLSKPQQLYGLPSATSIVFPIMGAKPNVVNKVIYAPLRKFIESMPYFQKHFMPSKHLDSEMHFEEKNIRIVRAGGDEDAILGEAVIGGGIDEINFMNVVQKSKKAEVSTGRAGLYDQAQQTHNRMVSRKKGRFTYKGPVIGIVFASSSTRYKGDFTDKRKAFVHAQGITTTYIYNRRQFDVVPAERFSGRTFRLLIGNEVVHDTRVLADDEQVIAGSWVEEVPIEYLDDFKSDPYTQLRDVMGISNNALSPFIKMRHKVYDCVEYGKELGLDSFLLKDHVILGSDGMPQVNLGHYCTNPGKPRYVHIDLSQTGDRCGIAMVRFDGMTSVTRSGGNFEILPMGSVEMACTIQPDANNEIDIAEVRSFVRMLKVKHGYPIKGVSYDGFDSRESIQQWRKDNMPARVVSVDRTSVPYKQMRDAMYDRRLALPDDDDLLSEIIELEYDTDKDKIDHSVIGKKDLSDAVCGAFQNMLDKRSTWEYTGDQDPSQDGRRGESERYEAPRR